MGRRPGTLRKDGRSGRRPCPGGARCHRAERALAAGTLLAAGFLAIVASAGPAAAQSFPGGLGGGSGAPAGKGERMLVEAKELVYNRDSDVVTAKGDVQIYYGGKVLQADKVVYYRKAKRVIAQGHTKMTDSDGSISYGSRFELTDDFRDGFIESLHGTTKDAAYITAPRAERIGGETTVFQRATYTACAPCAEHPEKPPLWQVRATRIIHKSQEQTIYYENATMELLGYPIAYFPYLSSPDPTVTRKTGILPPRYIYNSLLGYGVAVPVFWNMAPNYDLTFTPAVLSQQGFLGEAEFRQRLMYGSYNVVASGIFQADPKAFAPAPYDSQQQFRGSVQSTGKFYLSDKFTTGWDLSAYTDKFYPYDYRIHIQNLDLLNYFRDSISTVYLNGKGDRGYFDLRGYYIEGLDQRDIQKQQPIVHPVMDYNKVWTLPRSLTYGLGGELTFDANVTSLSRSLADYQQVGAQSLDTPIPQVDGLTRYGLFNTCDLPTGKTGNAYVPGNCLIRGIGGEYNRATAEVSWKRTFIDSFGSVWQPFAFARVSGVSTELNTSDSSGIYNSLGQPLSNANQLNYLNSSLSANAMPGIGLEYRFPLVATASWAKQIFEPIAQIIVRPDEMASRNTVNEDAQSLVFDDTNIFAWNKFSGYDRFEGGTRANVGAQYTANFSWGGTLSALVGQSYQLAGKNSYATGDLANVGLDSGLDKSASDYITRFSFTPLAGYNLIAKGNFDPSSFALKRLDVSATAAFGRRFSASALFSDYAAQPDIGFDVRREGLLLSGRYNVTDHYYLNGSVTFDLSPGHLNVNSGNLSASQIAANAAANKDSNYTLGLGAGYTDECTTFSINYASGYTYGIGTETNGQSVVAQLTFRTLGTVRVSQSLGATIDQIKQ